MKRQIQIIAGASWAYGYASNLQEQPVWVWVRKPSREKFNMTPAAIVQQTIVRGLVHTE